MARTIGSAAEQTRQRILDAGRELFVERGYAGTSVRDIADRLGMTKGSLYYHFTAKEELLYALMTPMMEAVDLLVARAGAACGTTAQLVAQLVDLLDEHGPVLRSLSGDPSVVHRMMVRLQLPARGMALERALGGQIDPATPTGQRASDSANRLRARCALGVIQAGVLAPTDKIAVSDTPDRPDPRPRLTSAEKAYVTRAALAVLALSPPLPDARSASD